MLAAGVVGGSLLLAGSATAAQVRLDSAAMAADPAFLDPEIAVVGRRPVTLTVNDKIAVVSSHPEGPSSLTLTALPPDPKTMRSKAFEFVKVEKGDTSQTWTF